MDVRVRKLAGKSLRHRVEFGPRLLGKHEELIGDPMWLIRPQGDQVSDLTLKKCRLLAGCVEADLCGGRVGERYLVTVRAETSKGRHLHHSFVVEVGSVPVGCDASGKGIYVSE